jgi:hypothetical protein
MNDDDPLACARIVIWIAAGAAGGLTLWLMLILAGIVR